MNELFQSGQHPNADQLNAFVEHALPVHEHQETLAHLALCVDCRAVLALSLPPSKETLPHPEPVRHPWFKGWRLLLPIATAATLAALVVVTVHIRNSSIARIGLVAPRMAEERTPPPVPAKQPEPIDATQRMAPIPATANQARPRLRAPVAAAKPTEERSPAVLPLQGRVTTALLGTSVGAPAAPPAVVGGATAASSANGAPVTSSLDAAASLLAQSLPQATTVLNYAPYSALTVGATAATGAAVNSSSMVPQSATALRSFSAQDLAQAILRAHPLPSGLAALSIVDSGRQNQTLAVDTNGALFITADSGEHWAPVAQQWPGRAIKVDLVYPGSVNPAVKRSPQFAPQAGSVGGPVAISSGVLPSSLIGSVTDATGATIPGATVIVSSAPTELARMVKTDAAGHYLIGGLVPGIYSIEASSLGFSKQQLTGVAVALGTSATANLTLLPSATAQTASVSAASNQLIFAAPQSEMKTQVPSEAAPFQALFEITTDTGEQWVSADGFAWKRK